MPDWLKVVAQQLIAPIALGIFFGIGWYANVQDDGKQAKADIAALIVFQQAQEATNIDYSNRLVRLENQRADDVAAVNQQLATVTQSLRDLSTSFNALAQSVALGQGQTQILLGQLGLTKVGAIK